MHQGKCKTLRVVELMFVFVPYRWIVMILNWVTVYCCLVHPVI